MLGGRHPCVQLTKQCLHNTPSRRPIAEQLVATLEEIRVDIEGPYGAVARADAVRQVVTMKMLKIKEIEEDKKTNELTEEIQRLQSQLVRQNPRYLLATCKQFMLLLLICTGVKAIRNSTKRCRTSPKRGRI